MRILMIEDNKPFANLMKAQLEKEKFVVDVAYQGNEGEELAFVNQYDAILLDLNLPDKQGIAILQFLRENGVNSPVIIVTARNEVTAKVKGLDLGADDYIIKPFETVELVSRIRAVIRRFYGRSNPDIVIGDFKLIPNARKVYIQGHEIPLSTKEFDILEYIATSYPTVVSTENIMEHIYDEGMDPFSSVIRVHMSNLKRKLVYEGKAYLKNIKGKGYVICE